MRSTSSGSASALVRTLAAVSYTHLDVYKRQVKRNAEHVSILNIKETFVGSLLIEIIGLAPQRSSDDLFAEELSSERSIFLERTGIAVIPVGY